MAKRVGFKRERRLASLAQVGAALLTVLLLGLPAVARPSSPIDDSEVERLRPHTEHLKTRMNKRTPVHLYQPTGAPAESPTIIYFSGYWGWVPLMQDTASVLAAQGRYVLGIESMDYFKKRIKPDQWAGELRVFRSYVNEKAGRPADAPVILVGFTFGAELIPYILNRAGADGVVGVLMISPDRKGDLVFRIVLQLEMPTPEKDQFDVSEELARMAPIPVVLMEGTDDDKAEARALFAEVKGPRKYVPIVGANRQFRDHRPTYFAMVTEAIEWIENHPAISPLPPKPPKPATGDEGAPPRPAEPDPD